MSRAPEIVVNTPWDCKLSHGGNNLWIGLQALRCDYVAQILYFGPNEVAF